MVWTGEEWQQRYLINLSGDEIEQKYQYWHRLPPCDNTTEARQCSSAEALRKSKTNTGQILTLDLPMQCYDNRRALQHVGATFTSVLLFSITRPSWRTYARARERRRACCYLCSSADRYRRFGGARKSTRDPNCAGMHIRDLTVSRATCTVLALKPGVSCVLTALQVQPSLHHTM